MKRDISFYIEVDEVQYWWTGKRFTENDERAMLYTLNKPLDFIKANFDKLPQVKQMLKLDPSLTIKDIKIW